MIDEGPLGSSAQVPSSPPRPYAATFEVTFRNNLRFKPFWSEVSHVPGFAVERESRSGELDLQQLLAVLDLLDRAGVASVTLQGGELLLRPGWRTVVEESRRRFFTKIVTNGTLLRREDVEFFKTQRLKVILYCPGAPEDLYDDLAQCPGAYAHFREGVDLLLEQGIKPVFLVPVTKPMVGKVGDTIDAVRKIGGRLLKFTVYPGCGYGAEFRGQLALSPAENLATVLEIEHARRRARDVLISYSYSAPFLPNMPCARLAVDASGTIMPCAYLRLPFGSIFTDDLGQVFARIHSEIVTLVGPGARHLPSPCDPCDLRSPVFGSRCWGGCRCVAYNIYGDLSGPDLGCPYLSLRTGSRA